MPRIRLDPLRSRWAVVLQVAVALSVSALSGWWLLHASGPTTAAAVVVAPPTAPMSRTPSASLPLGPAAPASASAPLPMPAASALQTAGNPAVHHRLDFDSVDDMYMLAVRAADSADLMAIENAMRAVSGCMSQSRARLEAPLVRAGSDPASRERVRSTREVLRRCAGFFNNNFSANAGLLHRLMSNMVTAPDYLSWALRADNASAGALIEWVDQGDWLSLQGVMVHNLLMSPVPGMADAPASAVQGPAAIDMHMAITLVTCDLGQNCGPDGFEYLAGCAASKWDCRGSRSAALLQDRTAEEQLQVQALRQDILAALRRGDVDYFRQRRR